MYDFRSMCSVRKVTDSGYHVVHAYVERENIKFIRACALLTRIKLPLAHAHFDTNVQKSFSKHYFFILSA